MNRRGPGTLAGHAGDSLPARFGLTRGAVAAITTIVAVGVAVSLLPPLVSLTLAGRGFSERTIGFVVATIAVASLLTSPFAARIAVRFGAANVIATVTPIAAVLIPLVWLTSDLRLLVPIIFGYGIVISLCFTLSEYWIGAATPERRRGAVMGFYATLLSIGFAIGPAILALVGTHSVRPYLIGAALMAFAALPAFAARDVSPDFGDKLRRPFASYLFAVPTATLGVFAFGMAESSGFAFLPLWGEHLNFSPATAPLLASAMTLGNVVFQIPLGLLADRVARRPMLLACGLIGAAGMALAWASSGSGLPLVAILFVWGGATAGIYTVALAHLASRFSGAELAGANAALVFCYALGMLIGPVIVGDAMARSPVGGLPLVLGLAFAGYSMVVAARLALRG
jgi:MFS family permease